MLVLALALRTLQTRPNLCTNTNTISLLNLRSNILADLDGLANDFVADAQWTFEFAPTTGDGVNVAATNTAGFNLDIDVAVLERLGLDFLLFKLVPCLGTGNTEAFESVWISHGESAELVQRLLRIVRL